MGYWQFFFDHNAWHDLYAKNCSLKSQDEWYAVGKPSPILGLTYFLSAFFFEITYIPFLIVMWRKEFFQHPCYKFMYLMGIYDVLILPCNGMITGIQVMLGAHFCNAPKLFYLTGAAGVCGFYGVAQLCVILAFDRFIEMGFPSVAPRMFGGKRVYIWMLWPFMYQIFVGFQLPHVFNIINFAMHPDPYHFIPEMEKNPLYNFAAFQRFFVLNNGWLIISLFVLYAGLIIVLQIKSKLYNVPAVSKAQKQMTYQALCICGEVFLSPLVHIFMLFWDFPVAVEIIAHFSWIALHGDTPVIYFALNKTLRKSVLKMLAPIQKFICKASNQSIFFTLTKSLNKIVPSPSTLNRNSNVVP